MNEQERKAQEIVRELARVALSIGPASYPAFLQVASKYLPADEAIKALSGGKSEGAPEPAAAVPSHDSNSGASLLSQALICLLGTLLACAAAWLLKGWLT